MSNLAKRLVLMRKWVSLDWNNTSKISWTEDVELLTIWNNAIKIRFITKLNDFKSVDVHYNKNSWLAICKKEWCEICNSILYDEPKQRFACVVFDYHDMLPKLLMPNRQFNDELRKVFNTRWSINDVDILVARSWKWISTRYSVSAMNSTIWNDEHVKIIKALWYWLQEKIKKFNDKSFRKFKEFLERQKNKKTSLY